MGDARLLNRLPLGDKKNSGRGSQSPVPSEDEDDEDAESTASSSADSDDEEWLPPSGRLKAQARSGPAARAPRAVAEAITLSTPEISLSPIRLPIDDTGQSVPVIDCDFDSHVAATEFAGDTLSVVVCGGFPVVT